jgi:hypothetical protein
LYPNDKIHGFFWLEPFYINIFNHPNHVILRSDFMKWRGCHYQDFWLLNSEEEKFVVMMVAQVT